MGESYIVKAGPTNTIRSEYMAKRIYEKLGCDVIPMSIDKDEEGKPVLVMPDLSQHFEPITPIAGSAYRCEGLRLGGSNDRL